MRQYRLGMVMLAWLSILLTGAAVNAQSDDATLQLGTKSHPNVVIFTPEQIDTPALDKAVDDLAHYLRLMVGETQVTRNVWHKETEIALNAVPIYVGLGREGATQLLHDKKVNTQGFAIIVGPGDIEIHGASDWGTVYGVYELLEQLGVRWLFPGDWGLVTPPPGSVSVRFGACTSEATRKSCSCRASHHLLPTNPSDC